MPARTWFWFTAPRAIRFSLAVGVVPLLASGPAVPLLLVTSFKVVRELSRPRHGDRPCTPQRAGQPRPRQATKAGPSLIVPDAVAVATGDPGTGMAG